MSTIIVGMVRWFDAVRVTNSKFILVACDCTNKSYLRVAGLESATFRSGCGNRNSMLVLAPSARATIL